MCMGRSMALVKPYSALPAADEVVSVGLGKSLSKECPAALVRDLY